MPTFHFKGVMGNHKRDAIEHALEEYGIGVIIDELKEYAKKEKEKCKQFTISWHTWDNTLAKLREIENLF